MRKRARIVAWLLAATLTAPGVPVVAVAGEYNLPDMGEPADTAMSPAEERKIGVQVITQLRAQHRIIDDAQVQAYLNEIGHRLASHTERAPDTVHFHLIDSDEVNAFALPGGHIGVNAGLIIATQTESELASVMAHELAHVTQRHIARQMAESRGDTIATLATALVAAIAGAQLGGGDAAGAAIMGGMSRLGMQQLSYTRAHEYEADRVGIHTLAAAGYDPHAMARFFNTLQRQGDLYGRQLPQILLSHPVTSTRMAEAEARAADYPDKATYQDPAYPYMRARARLLAADNPNTARDYFARTRQPGKTPALDYGYGIALIRTSHPQQALPILQRGMAAHPDIVAWPLATADALKQTGQTAKAHAMLAALLKRFPHADPVRLAYADNLNQSGQRRAMRQFLLGQPDLLDDYPETQRMLAEAAGDEHDLGEAYYRQARYFALLGDYPQAINQLRTALQTADLSHYNQSRLSALRDQMVDACQRAWSADQCRRAVAENSRY